MENTIQTIRRGPFPDRQKAHEAARKWIMEGGRVTEGEKTSTNQWYWKGERTVTDDNKHIEGDFPCGRCAKTGKFITMVENGKPKGPGGICFRCQGKGFHNQKDRRRNKGHDMYYMCGR